MEDPDEGSRAFVTTGTLADARTVQLDEPLPFVRTRVKVTVQPLPPAARRSYGAVIAEIRARQAARGYRPPTLQEVNAYLLLERDSWDERPDGV